MTQSDEARRWRLAALLLGQVATGRGRMGEVAGAVERLVGPGVGAEPPGALLAALAEVADPQLDGLRQRLLKDLLSDAAYHFDLRRQRFAAPADLAARLAGAPLDAPIGFETRAKTAIAVRQACAATSVPPAADLGPLATAELPLDLAVAACRSLAAEAGGNPLAAALAAADVAFSRQRLARAERTREAVAAADLTEPTALDADLAFSCLAAGFAARPPAAQRALLDRALLWPSDAALPYLAALCAEPWARERAMLVLTLRTGQSHSGNWLAWSRWLATMSEQRATAGQELAALCEGSAARLLLVWCRARGSPEAQLEELLTAYLRPPTRANEVETAAPTPAAAESPSRAAAEPPAAVAAAAAAAAPRMGGAPAPVAAEPGPPLVAVVTPAVPPRPPPLWRAHFTSFFAENWYLVLGLAMVVVGASLLAYYTWDEHWLIRFTVMPAVLAGFTASLAWLGRWLERKDPVLAPTATLFRGGAILLLPVNFMTVALLADDADVSHKAIAVTAAAAVYLALAGLGLRAWCGAVHPTLATLGAATLLALNALVVLAPLASVFADRGETTLRITLVAGFYLGFGVAAWAFARFSRRARQPGHGPGERGDQRVVAFFGAVLAATLVQVFVWVHGFVRLVPAVETYSLLVVGLGGLVLLADERLHARRAAAAEASLAVPRQLEISFAGYALVLVGILMAIGHPYLRVATLLAAAAVWLVQAWPRQQPLHFWIGGTLAGLAVAGVAVLPFFPTGHAPALGVALALALLAAARWPRFAASTAARRSAIGLHLVVVMLTAAVAPMLQVQYQSSAWACAAYLAAAAALFFWRALATRQLRWLFCAVFVAPFSLPYLGCLDLAAADVGTNRFAFGLAALSALWLLVVWRAHSELLTRARSTVVVFYGALAVAAALLGLFGEPVFSSLPVALGTGARLLGPILMAAALGVAAYHTRSLVPSLIAAALLAIVFPDLRASMRLLAPGVGHGSGLASAVAALAVTALCFWLRGRASLKDLAGGDTWLGERAFPWRRTDHSLFTGPLLVLVVAVCVKVDTLNLGRAIVAGGRSSTAAAVLLVAATWTLLAIYRRARRGAVLLTYVGLAGLLAAFVLGSFSLTVEGRWTALAAALSLQALWALYRLVLVPRLDWAVRLLLAPARNLLEHGSLLAGLGLAGLLLLGASPVDLGLLLAFVAAQYVWHGLARRRAVHGVALFLLTLITLLAAVPPGLEPHLFGLTPSFGWLAAVGLCLAVALGHTALEASDAAHARLRPLARPFLFGSAILLVLLAIVAGLHLATRVSPPAALPLLGLEIAALVVTAMVFGRVFWSPLALVALAVTYGLVEVLLLAPGFSLATQPLAALRPFDLALLAVVLVSVGAAGATVSRRWPRLVAGPHRPARLATASSSWAFVPAAGLALVGVARLWLDPDHRFHLACAAALAVALAASAVGLERWRAGRALAWVGLVSLAALYACAAIPALGAPWPTAVGAGAILLLAFGLYLGLSRLVPRLDPLLLKPTRLVLAYGSLAASVVLTGLMFLRGRPADVAWLLVFVAAQLFWHGLASRRVLFCATLFALVVVAALGLVTPDTDWLLGALRFFPAAPVGLGVCSVVILAHLPFEGAERWYERLRPLLRPFQLGALLLLGAVAAAAIGASLVEPLLNTDLARRGLVALAVAATLVLAGRMQRSAAFSWLALVVAYLGINLLLPPVNRPFEARLFDLFAPAHLVGLAAAFLFFGVAASRLGRRWPWLTGGPHLLAPLVTRGAGWYFLPAVGLALVVCGLVFGSAARRANPYEVGALFVAATVLGLAALAWRQAWLHYPGWVVLLAANTQMVAALWGAPLGELGLTSIHLGAIGLAATLVMTTVVTRLLRESALATTARFASLVMAALAIALLAAAYLLAPDVGAMSVTRLVVAGAIAYLAGLYVRHAARLPTFAASAWAPWLESVYHLGVTMALWCLALLVPWLRQPATAYFALSLPFFYFYLRAELSLSGDATSRARHRSSATVLGFVLLGLYAFRVAFELLVFPESPPTGQYYHYNAPVALVLSLLLLRLHGVGGTFWLAIYGGFGVVGASFFLVTLGDGLSPFSSPARAALSAGLLVHGWLAAAGWRTPAHARLRQLAGIDDALWARLATTWASGAIIAAHLLTAVALAAPATDWRWAGPLLALCATLLGHGAWRRRSPWLLAAAVLELVVALHAGFVVESWLPASSVVWAIFLVWALVLLLVGPLARGFNLRRPGLLCLGLALVSAVHVGWHHPGSWVGLVAVALIFLFGAASPFEEKTLLTGDQRLGGWLLMAVPAWLAFFSQADLAAGGLAAALAPWPILLTAAILLAQAWASSLATGRLDPWLARAPQRLVRVGMELLDRHGRGLLGAALWVVMAAILLVRYLLLAGPLAWREVVLMVALYVALGIAWFRRGQLDRLLVGFLLAEVCVEEVYGVIRRQVVLTNPDAWSPTYEVWAALVASLALGAVKELLPLRRESLIPVVGALLALPVAALTWIYVAGLGTDLALIVIGTESLLFAFLGRTRRAALYNLIAVGGFVSFVLVVFNGKLELTTLQAYVIPVGAGILALVHLLAERVPPRVRLNVRLITLLAMLASAGYYALADPSFPVAFHLVFLLLGLAVMALGTLLRVRLYVLLGFAAAVVDLGALVVKAVVGMQRTLQMSLIGALVLALGAGLVIGAAYFKAHRERLVERLAAWRGRLAAWE